MADSSPSWTTTLSQILESCPQSRLLAYRPTRPSLAYIVDCELPPSRPMRLYESLEIIAARSSITKLRKLYSPGLTEVTTNRHNANWIREAGYISHYLAGLIFSYLHSQGSGMKTLSLSPNSRWKQPQVDTNLYYYPHFYHELQIGQENVENAIKAVPLETI